MKKEENEKTTYWFLKESYAIMLDVLLVVAQRLHGNSVWVDLSLIKIGDEARTNKKLRCDISKASIDRRIIHGHVLRATFPETDCRFCFDIVRYCMLQKSNTGIPLFVDKYDDNNISYYKYCTYRQVEMLLPTDSMASMKQRFIDCYVRVRQFMCVWCASCSKTLRRHYPYGQQKHISKSMKYPQNTPIYFEVYSYILLILIVLYSSIDRHSRGFDFSNIDIHTMYFSVLISVTTAVSTRSGEWVGQLRLYHWGSGFTLIYHTENPQKHLPREVVQSVCRTAKR